MNTPNPSDTQTDLSRVLAKIAEIAEKSATGSYIYRGEPECYDEVTSTLYREYADFEGEDFDIEIVQNEILREAKEYTTHKMDDLEILTELQHHGGKTNLIDFTTDYLVALFFACGGNRDKPGRVILLQKQSKTYKPVRPPRTTPRAGRQKSLFVQAPKGIVDPDTVVCIPADLKGNMLDYLLKHHDISPKTIYNDLLGFIEKRESHKSAYTEFYTGLTCQERGDSAKNSEKKQEWYDKAIKHYTEAIDLNPEFPDAYNSLGTVHEKKGGVYEAIKAYSKAIELKPRFSELYNNRANAYSRKNDFTRAIQDYGKAIKFNPQLADAYSGRGVARLHLGEWEEAEADLTTARSMKLDIIASLERNYENIEDFEKRNKVGLPENIKAIYAAGYVDRGDTYRPKERKREALTYNQTIALNPQQVKVFKEQEEKAISVYNQAITLNPQYVEVYMNRGRAYFSKYRIDHSDVPHKRVIEDPLLDAAIEDWTKVIELCPTYVDAYGSRGWAYCHKGDLKHAVSDFKKVLELQPNASYPCSTLGEIYLAQEKWNEAKNYLTKAKNKGEDIIKSLHNDYKSLADFAGKNGIQLPENIKNIYAERYVYSGRICHFRGTFEAAVQNFNKAIELNPELAEAYINRGETRLHEKKWEKAKADLITAKDMGIDIVAVFHNDYGSVEDFEAKHGVKVPEDIAALLR